MTTPASRPPLSMKPEGETDYKPLKPGIYPATFISYTVREHAPDPNGKYPHEKAGFCDFECRWQVYSPVQGRVERRTYPRVTLSADEKSNLVQMWVALGVADLAELRKNGVGDVYSLMDRCLGRSCLCIMEAAARKDGSLGDKIKAMTPAMASSAVGLDGRGHLAEGADAWFDRDESDIPF